jgi:ribosomal protein L37E
VGGFDAAGRRTASDLFECAAWHIAIVATCRKCGREAVFDPHALWHLYARKGWRNDLRSVQRRLKCRVCGARAFMSLSRDRASTVALEMPTAADWKKAVSRYRA